jgi:DNA-binding transcriptional ArsR family regulator
VEYGYEADEKVGEEARMNDLFDDSENDPLMDSPLSKTASRFIGCPVAWLKRVLPLVGSADQLAILMWLHRRRIVCGGREWFTVPAKALEEDLGLSRFTRYRALEHLKQAGGIAVSRDGNKAMLVKLLW